MTLRVYGIVSCDSCRKARRWLDEHGLSHEWSDLRADGIEGDRIAHWLRQVDPTRLVNRRSTTWRNLPDNQRPALAAADLPEFLAEHPTLIKRPVFERDGEVRVGFDDATRTWLART
jgi:arsenate reductase